MYVILLILPICLRFCPGLRVYTVAYTLATLDKIVNKSEKKVKNFFLGNCGKISYIWFMRKNYYIWFLEIMRKISYIRLLEIVRKISYIWFLEEMIPLAEHALTENRSLQRNWLKQNIEENIDENVNENGIIRTYSYKFSRGQIFAHLQILRF